MKIFYRNISNRRELAALSLELNRRWAKIMEIKDKRKRCKEALKFKASIKVLLSHYKSANSNNYFDKVVVREILSWLNRDI